MQILEHLRAPRLAVVSAALAGLLIVDLLGAFTLWRYGMAYRFVEVSSLAAIEAPRMKHDFPAFRAELARQAWANTSDSASKYIEILRWSMNQVTSVAATTARDPEAILRHVHKGEGALCDQMSRLYSAGLTSMGLRSRTVWLFRNLPGRDTHSLVEVPLNGKWVLLDPTFGVSYQNAQGQLLSAQEIKAKLFSGDYSDVRPRTAASGVRYPARLDAYYMNFLPLFNNVFVLGDNFGTSWLGRVPPFRYWLGEKLYYERVRGEANDNLRLLQFLYALFVLVLPLACLLLSVALVTMMIEGSRMTHRPVIRVHHRSRDNERL